MSSFEGALSVIGKTLVHYEINALLGKGGMGEVYRARDTRLDRDVALKLLPESFSTDQERVARFRREAKLLASLNHPNIASIHGLEESGGHRYLVLEFVDGENLEERLKRGALPVDDALEVGAQIALALETAHESGIVHRDLKPGNVMLTSAGSVKVLDFGLAKAQDTESATSSPSVSPTATELATEAGAILGTAAYMSPEQARGRPLDRRSDIWSFGCVLYECLTGKRAFEGETVSDLIAKLLEREPDWSVLPARTPPRVRELLRRCLTKDASQRLRDIGEARIALTGTNSSPGLAAGEFTQARRRGLPWPWIITAVAAIALGTLVLRPRGEHAAQPLWVSVMLPPDQRLDAGPEFNLLAIAPDGMSVAYVARSAGAYRLYLRRLDDGSTTVLPGTEEARNPFFSPDGEWVGFTAGTKLKKVSVQGGTPVDLADVSADRGAVWDPDGSIVYTPSFGDGLYRVPYSGGEPLALTALDTARGERTHRWPDAIAGSEWVVFTVGTQDSPGGYDDSDIEAVSLRTEQRRKIARGASARFAPGGKLIVARSGTLYEMPLDPQDPQPGGALKPVLDGVLGQPTSGAVFFDIAENGTLAYAPGPVGRDLSRLHWVDLAGRRTPIPGEPMEINRINLSPDGTLALLEVGSGGGTGTDVWLVDLTEETTSRLTFDGRNSNPVFMPDGKHFVWSAKAQNGDETFMIRALDGSDSGRSFGSLAGIKVIDCITPDGAEIVLSDYGKVEADIWSLPIHGNGGPRRVVEAPLNQGRSQVSPDAKWIAYVSNETGQAEVYVAPWDRPGIPSQLTRSGGIYPFWSADGTTMFFVSQGSMYRMPLSPQGSVMRPGTPERLFDLDVTKDSYFKQVALHPSGENFLICMPESANERREIGIVSGWAPDLDAKP